MGCRHIKRAASLFCVKAITLTIAYFKKIKQASLGLALGRGRNKPESFFRAPGQRDIAAGANMDIQTHFLPPAHHKDFIPQAPHTRFVKNRGNNKWRLKQKGHISP